MPNKDNNEITPKSPGPELKEPVEENQQKQETGDNPKELPLEQEMRLTAQGTSQHKLKQLFLDILGKVVNHTQYPNVVEQTKKLFDRSKSLELQDGDIEALIVVWKLVVDNIVKTSQQLDDFTDAAELIGMQKLIEDLYDELISHTKRTGTDDLVAQIMSLY